MEKWSLTLKLLIEDTNDNNSGESDVYVSFFIHSSTEISQYRGWNHDKQLWSYFFWENKTPTGMKKYSQIKQSQIFIKFDLPRYITTWWSFQRSGIFVLCLALFAICLHLYLPVVLCDYEKKRAFFVAKLDGGKKLTTKS